MLRERIANLLAEMIESERQISSTTEVESMGIFESNSGIIYSQENRRDVAGLSAG